MLWIVILTLTAVVLFVIVQPFFRTYADSAGVDETDYLASQILEIDRDLESGAISEGEAEDARQEARRRLLTQKRRSDGAPKPLSPMARQAGVMLAVAAPFGALAMYVALGAPGYNREAERSASSGAAALAQGRAASSQEGQQRAQATPDLTQAAVQLRQRLEREPDDIDGWVMLGRTQAALGNFAASAEAFGRAAMLAPETASHYAAQGEALVAVNDGVVIESARDVLGKALAIDPQEPRARYYMARYVYQTGDKSGALQALVDLANDSPNGAPWLEVVREEIVALAAETGVSIDDLELTDAPPSGVAQSAPRAQPSAQALEVEIATGDAPYTVWVALINAYQQSGDAEKAADALRRAEERYAGAPFVLQELAKLNRDPDQSGSSLDGAGQSSASQTASGADQRRGPTSEQVRAVQALDADEQSAMIAGMVANLEARLEDEPDDLEGWIMLARSFGVLGDPVKSANAYARAIELAPDNIDVRIAYAQALLTKLDLDQKSIDEMTEDALRDVITLDPVQPFALYFLGLAAQQQGDASQARAHWTKLLTQIPENSPDAERIKDLIQSL